MTQRIEIKEIKANNKENSDRFNPSNRIYVRAAYGLFQKIRRYSGWGLILFFVAMPLLRWDGHQAVLFDVDQQQFHFFNMIFFPQDLTLLAWAFIIAAFALFFFTTYLGRVWCGYTCPQTVWTFIFIWFEERFEGPANKRKRLDQMPWDFNKIWRKTAKHTGWLVVSLLTGLAFCSYFVPVERLYVDFFTGQSSMILLVMIFIFTASTYANAGWMRSIFCIHMCPYSRFQSAMFDKNTYIVGYDTKRGETRGPRSRKADRNKIALGDCVDCDLCVQVCPSGIDIRDGLQYECINCGACIDACDYTMEKMGYPKGLISYTSEQMLEGKETKVLRPKIIGYGLMLLVMLGLFIVNLSTLTKADMDILRDRNALYRENDEGLIENTYTLKIINKTIEPQVYSITLSGVDNASLVGPSEITINSGEIFTQPISIAVDTYEIEAKKLTITIKLTNQDDGEVIEQDASFFTGS